MVEATAMIDLPRFIECRNLLGEAIGGLVEQFRVLNEDLLQALAAAEPSDEKPDRELTDHAHRLRSTALTLGANGLAQAYQQIEYAESLHAAVAMAPALRRGMASVLELVKNPPK